MKAPRSYTDYHTVSLEQGYIWLVLIVIARADRVTFSLIHPQKSTFCRPWWKGRERRGHREAAVARVGAMSGSHIGISVIIGSFLY